MFSIEHLRSFRIYQIAIFDVAISYLAIYLLSPLLIKLFRIININTNRSNWLWLMFPISIIVHLLIGQETTLTKIILEPTDNLPIKALILFMLIMGLRKN